MIALAAGMFLASCSKTPTAEPEGNTADGMRVTHVWNNGNTDGTMQAYFNAQLGTYNYRQYSPEASLSILSHHPMTNVIYRYQGSITNDATHTTNAFVPVLGTRTNPNAVWREAVITFNAGYTPHQFYKVEDIQAAASGNAPKITVVPTNTVYRISTGATFDRYGNSTAANPH